MRGAPFTSLFQVQKVHSQSYTTAASALATVDKGAVLVAGPPADLQEWLAGLPAKPGVHLLTLKRCAAPVLAGLNGTALPPQAARLHFANLHYRDAGPSAPRGRGWAWRYGYTAARAVFAALRSSPTARAFTTPEDVLDAMYNLSAIRTAGLTLGLYYRSTCRFDGDQECLCSQGTRTLAVRPALARSARPAHVYSSETCEVQYEPLRRSHTVAIVAGVAAGAVVLVAGAAAANFVAWRMNRRNNAWAPKDERQPFCIVFTDLQSSTHLWAAHPLQMPGVLDQHHRLIRKLIAQHKCYEVKTIGDSFMVAARSPPQALAFSLGVQRSFYSSTWGIDGLEELYHCNHCADGTSRGEGHGKGWGGLRVRMGIHYGLGTIELDPVTKGYDYYGSVVNMAARIEAACHGGQIAVSQAVYDFCNGRHAESYWTALGPQNLKGLREPVELWQILPAGDLSERQFPCLRVDHQANDQYTDLVSDADGAMTACSGAMSHYGRGATDYSLNLDAHFLEAHGGISYSLQDIRTVTVGLLMLLLAPADEAFRKQMLKKLCKTFRVQLQGIVGPPLETTVRNLVTRLLPSAIGQCHHLAPPTPSNGAGRPPSLSSLSNKSFGEGVHAFT